ncbi:hypothetical protein AEB_P3311 [Altererythrobacter sp. B11]|uniref:hypothetical protein n=1 Tax=Altererythrobacter sp. B11 TaxID=2060312 RepID=UPI000DC72F9E|nr:hypothetical protein [Altererythrobacter sp. B11]BBC74179.1 hypothetical protein AEB_P3311 [Altererythrobacter sp. B11]
MKKTITALFGITLLATATPALLAQSKEPQKKKKDEASERVDPDAMKCKYQTLLDSRIPQKVCHTNAEWAEQARFEEEQRRSDRLTRTCNGEGPC